MAGTVDPPLNRVLRLEGACYALAALYMFYGAGISWWWFAHVGFDRALGDGLKYPDGFAHTHLGWIGRSRR